MAHAPSAGRPDAVPSPTAGETRRVGVALAAVGSRTLLRTLAMLCPQGEDAALIIATLLDRLPPDRDDPPGRPDAPAQDPVMPR